MLLCFNYVSNFVYHRNTAALKIADSLSGSTNKVSSKAEAGKAARAEAAASRAATSGVEKEAAVAVAPATSAANRAIGLQIARMPEEDTRAVVEKEDTMAVATIMAAASTVVAKVETVSCLIRSRFLYQKASI